MKTLIKKAGDTVVVSMDGKLDFETSGPLREDLSKLLRNTAKNAKTDTVATIVVDLERLEFVGSSGISSFVQTMKEFNASAPTRPRYTNVGSEFKQVIRAFDEEALFDIDDADQHRSSKKPIDN